jgi:hypothetical protein
MVKRASQFIDAVRWYFLFLLYFHFFCAMVLRKPIKGLVDNHREFISKFISTFFIPKNIPCREREEIYRLYEII